MGHTKESWIAEEGFKVGTPTSNTEVIDSSGKLVAGLVAENNIAAIAAYSATGAVTVGKPVYISGMSTVDNVTPRVSLAKADDRTKAAQFVAVTGATAQHKPMTLANMGLTSHDSTLAVGTVMYLDASAAGAITNTAPTVMFAQPVGMIATKAATASGSNDGTLRVLLAYSQAVNPAST